MFGREQLQFLFFFPSISNKFANECSALYQFCIKSSGTLYPAILASNSFDNSGFSSYPNPVVDVLNLSYSKNIDKVQIVNLLGQEVVTKVINATDAKVDMSQLASGTYLVKVTSDSQVKTLKVIKQ